MIQELKTTSILALFDTDKTQRQSFVSSVLTLINAGEINPLDIQLQLKCMEDIIKQLTSNENYRKSLLEEAQKHGKTFEYHGQKVEIKETGVKYNYSQCNDPIYEALSKEEEVIAAGLKGRETLLKTIPSSGLEIRHEDELITIYPPSKSSTTAIAITLK